MAESNVLEIVRGLAQAAANAYDGAHDERYVPDGEDKKVGLKREEGDPILDKRVMDGFKIKFYGNKICIKYQADIKLKDIYKGGFENEVNRMINKIKSFLQKEYKAVTGKSITLKKDGEVEILAQSVSRVRSFVQASQHFKISGIKEDEGWKGSEGRKVDVAIRKFLDLKSTKKPKNVTRKKG